jgi:ketosteroid isomerase-like protein
MSVARYSPVGAAKLMNFVRNGILVAALVALGLALVPAQSDDEGGARTKIMALENVWNNAEKARDTAALDLILDNEMVYIDEDGSLLTKAQFLEHTKQSGPQLQTLATSAVSVHVYGQTALASGTYRVSGVARGKAFQRQGRFIDTWVLKNGSWLCVAAQSTPVAHASL